MLRRLLAGREGSAGPEGSLNGALWPLALLLTLNAAPTWGQVPVGGEFQVNTFTTDVQQAPSVAVSANGDFVVIWENEGGSVGSDTGLSIAGQRYAADGTPQGGEFQVNTYTTGYQNLPSVAAAPGSDFVVAWTSYGSSGTDTSEESVQAQRYVGCPCFDAADLAGTPIFGTCQALGPWSGGYTTYLGWPFFSGQVVFNHCWFWSPFAPNVSSSITPAQYPVCRQLLIDAATNAGVACPGV